MQTQPTLTEHLSPELAQIFLEGLPETIVNNHKIIGISN